MAVLDGGKGGTVLVLASLRLTVVCCLSFLLLLSVLQVAEGTYLFLWVLQAFLEAEAAARRSFPCRM